jgi:hypothetical protein
MEREAVKRSDVAEWGMPYEGLARKIIRLTRECLHSEGWVVDFSFDKESDLWSIRVWVRGGCTQLDSLPAFHSSSLEDAVDAALAHFAAACDELEAA